MNIFFCKKFSIVPFENLQNNLWLALTGAEKECLPVAERVGSCSWLPILDLAIGLVQVDVTDGSFCLLNRVKSQGRFLVYWHNLSYGPAEWTAQFVQEEANLCPEAAVLVVKV